MKRTQRPQRRCIFCSGTPISREHIFPEWMRPYLPFSEGSAHAIRQTKHDKTGGKLVHLPAVKGQLDRPGDHRSKKLKVVCIACNTGWMSVLQSAAKPLLIPLMQGDWRPYNPAEQRILALWATMFTMVFEHSVEDKIAIPAEVRKLFKEQGDGREPPRNWLIGVGRYDDDNALPVWNRFIGATKASPVHNVVNVPCQGQLTLCSFGQLALLTFSIADDEAFGAVQASIKKRMLFSGFRIIWPQSTVRITLKRPTHRIVKSDGSGIMNSVTAVFAPREMKGQLTGPY
jgi:hypothetical protein